MNTRALVAGVGVGAALAFVLDPDRGRRRRALLTDKVRHAARVTGRGLDATVRDIGNRTRGIAAATRGRWSNADAGSPETRRLDIMQRRWAPATRALVSASVIGTAICLKTFARRRNSAAPAPDSLVA